MPDNDTPRKITAADTALALLEMVQQLARELNPAIGTLHLDSALEQDAGIDSLARMELLLRIERRFGCSVPDDIALAALTPRELLQHLKPSRNLPTPQPDILHKQPISATVERPTTAASFVEVLEWQARQQPQRTALYLYSEDERVETLSYAELWEGAQRCATGLRLHGLEPGQSVALMLPTSLHFFFCFYGVWLAGGVPAPLYPPARLSQLEEHLRRQIGILDNAQAHLLIAMPEALRLGPLLKAHLPTLRAVLTADELTNSAALPLHNRPSAQDLALLQYTSGSTGQPKGVALTHANLLANVRAMGAATGVTADDVFVSWLPLYHDMGLIGACLGTLYHGFPLVLMSPLTFIARPQRWLRAIQRHHGTLSAAPNFAYELCAGKLADEDLTGLDLSSWRLAFNGAEPVSPDTVDHFCARFASYGFKREAMAPVYGLAESCVGLAFPPPGRGPRLDRIRRSVLLEQGRAEIAAPDEDDAMRVPGCGLPLPGHNIRIIDASGREVGERHVGRVLFNGPSATQGYHRNPDATRALCQGDWLDTGDYGYLADGEIHITGRAKDVIIRAGRNIYPYELEEAVALLPGLRKSGVVVFASPDPRSGSDRLIVLAETRERQPDRLEVLRGQIQQLTLSLTQTPADDVVLAPPRTILKTSSGKLRRAACRDLYQRGALLHRRAVWWQMTRLALSGIGPLCRRGLNSTTEYLYSGYAWCLLILLTLPTWVALMLLPKRAWRRALARGCVRLLRFGTGIRLTVEGLENIPRDRPYVLAVNHASYLDTFFLMEALAADFDFVAKRELMGNLFTRLLLPRVGSQFVERIAKERGLQDTEQLTSLVRNGYNLLFFPEGTFVRAPGLLPFRMGTFTVASRSAAPVVPIAIRGTRAMLPDDDNLLRHGSVHVTILPALEPHGSEWEAAMALRNACRAAIAAHCGEPDLDSETST